MNFSLLKKSIIRLKCKTQKPLVSVMRYTTLMMVLVTVLANTLFATGTNGQNLGQIKISLGLKNKSLTVALQQIERFTPVRFAYKPEDLVAKGTVSMPHATRSVAETLGFLLSGTDLTFKQNGSYILIFRKTERDAPLILEADRQPLTVKGTVTDRDGQPLVGVSVKVKDQPMGVSTEERGGFQLSVPNAGVILVFSYIGFDTKEVALDGRVSLTVILESDVRALEEVVVIGYGWQRKGDVTSSVATVTAENFVKAPVQDAGQLLQGKVAGLSVSTPSGNPASGSQILLRGNTTLFGANSDPLVIIDGVPGTLRTVAPEDIESMDVLKDGSAAAIYGVRGTNGVIIITTKRAKGTDVNVIEYSGSASTQTVLRKPELLTADDYRRQVAAGTREASWDLGSDTDWLKEISQTPLTHIHNLTFRGGSSKTNYLASANYRYLEGILKRSDNETFTGRIDVNHNMLEDKLRFNLSVLNQTNKFTQTQDGGSFNGYTYRQALIFNPTSPIYDDEGNWFEQPANFNYENPLSRLYESDGLTRSVNSRMVGTITYNPIQDLKLSSLFSYSRDNLTAGYAETKQHISTLRDNLNGYAALGNRLTIDRLVELTAEYSKTIGSHRGSLLGGYGYQENETSSNFIQNWDFPSDIFGYNNVGLGNAIKDGKGAIGSDKYETNLISFFGRFTYSYADKYLLLASVRHEGASQLVGANSPWGTFAAVSGGWRISNEPFMAGQTLVNDLKLRAGYGVTGNPPSNLFLGQAQLGYGSYIYNDGRWVQSLGPTTNPNPYIRWEEKHESNFGLDFSMLEGRISGNIDYYIRDIKGLLYDYQVPSPPNLVATTRANVGTMRNNGLEVALNITPVRRQAFDWNTTLLFSTNKNRLKSLSNELYQTTNNYITAGATGEPIQTFTHIVYIGQQIGDFYGFKVMDIDESGKWIYEGTDGSPVAYDDFDHNFEDKKILGNGLPKYYAGWNNSFRYKNVDLSITMRGAFDYQILNFQRMYFENPTLQNYNRLASSEELVFGKALLTAPLEFNSYYVENGDHWKIDNITIGYTFNAIRNKLIKSARVFATSLNTLVISGYKGIDPEVNRLGLAPGNDDRDKYPTTRTFTFGVNVSF